MGTDAWEGFAYPSIAGLLPHFKHVSNCLPSSSSVPIRVIRGWISFSGRSPGCRETDAHYSLSPTNSVCVKRFAFG
jgi:hypothetical protein